MRYLAALRKPHTPRDKKYLSWISKQPCIRGHQAPSEPHHEGDRGIGIKASDYSTLPMCRLCHMERHQIGKNIFNLWGLNPETIIAALQQKFKNEGGEINE